LRIKTGYLLDGSFFFGLIGFDFWFSKNKYILQGYVNVLNTSKILLNLINMVYKPSKNKRNDPFFIPFFLKKSPLLLANFEIGTRGEKINKI
jgi:hypothetical protein